MKIAAAYALANLTKEPVPYQVEKVYGGGRLRFGPEYIIPKPFDPRVLIWEASAVAQAAMETGVARIEIDIEEYREELEGRLGMSRKVMRVMINKARTHPKLIVFPEGDQLPVIKACETILDERMAQPILLGPRQRIEAMAEESGIPLDSALEIIDPRTTDRHDRYEQEFYRMRQRKGVTVSLAHELMLLRNYFGAMMVHLGEADGIVSGLTTNYADTLRPALQIIGTRPDVRKAAGMTILAMRDQLYFFADVSVTIDPTAEELADIAILCANRVREFELEPRLAMVSFSNFGSVQAPEAEKMRRAVELVRERAPGLKADGEMQADTAISPDMLEENFPFSDLKGGANILIFPCLNSSNAACKLAQRFSGAESIGPILLGMNKPAHIMEYGGYNEADIVNMTALAVVDAQGAVSDLLRK